MFRILEGLISLVMGVIEIFLGLRFIFRLLDANPAAPFVGWLYETTRPLLNPFANIFPAPHLARGYVVEFSTLVALVIYLFAGYLLLELVAAIRGYSLR
ncbi:MAG: YggT family protein [Candidatus Pacebacteria bacterium]|nr:YggT family protein [Candidatus Paceibacterota bacterium]